MVSSKLPGKLEGEKSDEPSSATETATATAGERAGFHGPRALRERPPVRHQGRFARDYLLQAPDSQRARAQSEGSKVKKKGGWLAAQYRKW